MLLARVQKQRGPDGRRAEGEQGRFTAILHETHEPERNTEHFPREETSVSRVDLFPDVVKDALEQNKVCVRMEPFELISRPNRFEGENTVSAYVYNPRL